MQLIKGESSFWINKNMVLESKFEWADEYFGISVSESHLSTVRAYIKNQNAHHQKKSWAKEFEELMQQFASAKNDG